ncbi:MAG: 4-(cytidine 5'-diphospho)-2-C-methyl-D-erythritol kinase [Oscillospiraceae bacterium]|jgi:4-diphosphocytidyl-2-C-methyl-D-erythritol kinase|nr:4-(cytidine 5'-diphospho)-2-C-methyl-D-erythritol kinase [Oscillospiraceae bacterium]
MTRYESAPAKINLTLDVLGKRPDGYHDLRMLMQTVALADTVALTHTDRPRLEVTSNLPYLPADGNNLAGRAAAALLTHLGLPQGGFRIQLEKKIPVCAGLGGGSADAAAVLRLLNRALDAGLTGDELKAVAFHVGSDVPFCVRGGTQLAEGRGERLTPLPAPPPCHIVLCKPPCPVSTAAVFARWRDKPHHAPDHLGAVRALETGSLRELARRLYNVLEDLVPSATQSDIVGIRTALLDAGALGVVMSGSGPTVLGLFETKSAAQTAWDTLSPRYRETYLTEPVGPSL